MKSKTYFFYPFVSCKLFLANGVGFIGFYGEGESKVFLL